MSQNEGLILDDDSSNKKTAMRKAWAKTAGLGALTAVSGLISYSLLESADYQVDKAQFYAGFLALAATFTQASWTVKSIPLSADYDSPSEPEMVNE